MNLGKISFTDADAIDRQVTLNTERRHQFRKCRAEPPPAKPYRVCPDCNLIRALREFQIGGQMFLNCVNCHAKHGRKKA